VGLGEVLEERDGGRRAIGEVVEEEERARVDRAADERVNLAERQRERGAVSLSCGVFMNQLSDRWRLLAMVTTNGIPIAHAKPDGV
jgi:hypothetical protein